MSTATDLPTGGTIVDEPRTRYAEPGDHDVFTHYVPRNELTDAIVFGRPVTALCGKRWVPYRDPDKYPICPDCKDILAQLEITPHHVE